MAAMAPPTPPASDDPLAALPAIGPDLEASFRQDGFVVLEHGLPADTCELLCERLEAILRGVYDTGFETSRHISIG
jgi:hypothetical protein